MLNILATSTNFCDCLIRLFIFLGHVMNIIKIVIPVIIILMGSIDFIKAIIAQKDDEIKKTQKIFVKRLIYGVAVFFVISIVSFLIGLVGGDTNNRCFKCVANVNSEECDKENIPVCKKAPENVEKPDEPQVIPEPETEIEDNTEEPDLTGWNCSDEAQTPIEGCRVHFSDLVIGDKTSYKQKFFTITNENIVDRTYNDILGKGNYANSINSLPNSYKITENSTGAYIPTLDTIVIDKNTRLIIYKENNFNGEFYIKDGPLLMFGSHNREEDINSWIETTNRVYNGITFPYEKSPTPLYGEYSGIGSFKICCKN
ncbi:MAG: hypothetical protein IJO32_02390 [Bacilli bacterium]|nr:hypothetical protein [Bacilli bacterium]